MLDLSMFEAYVSIGLMPKVDVLQVFSVFPLKFLFFCNRAETKIPLDAILLGVGIEIGEQRSD
jgi:hypothetical protein